MVQSKHGQGVILSAACVNFYRISRIVNKYRWQSFRIRGKPDCWNEYLFFIKKWAFQPEFVVKEVKLCLIVLFWEKTEHLLNPSAAPVLFIPWEQNSWEWCFIYDGCLSGLHGCFTSKLRHLCPYFQHNHAKAFLGCSCSSVIEIRLKKKGRGQLFPKDLSPSSKSRLFLPVQKCLALKPLSKQTQHSQITGWGCDKSQGCQAGSPRSPWQNVPSPWKNIPLHVFIFFVSILLPSFHPPTLVLWLLFLKDFICHIKYWCALILLSFLIYFISTY